MSPDTLNKSHSDWASSNCANVAFSSVIGVVSASAAIFIWCPNCGPSCRRVLSPGDLPCPHVNVNCGRFLENKFRRIVDHEDEGRRDHEAHPSPPMETLSIDEAVAVVNDVLDLRRSHP